ncbi:MAG: glutaredoxin family protein [Lachnospirales bacterium]
MKLYTQPQCTYCLKVRQFLKDLNVNFTEIDLATDIEGQEFMDSRGYTELPVVVIGDTEISGYKISAIRRAIM